MDSGTLRDAHVCIFNYLADLKNGGGKIQAIDGYVFLRLDFFFFFFNKAKHFYINVKGTLQGLIT